MSNPDIKTVLTEPRIMELAFSNFTEGQIKAMSYESWKDGIDITVPTIELEQFARAIEAAVLSALAEKDADAVPTEPGLYAFLTDGTSCLVRVDRRSTGINDGGILKGHVLNSSKFYDACPIDAWTGGKWIALQSAGDNGDNK